MPSDAEVQALFDKQAITDVVCRYARGVDRLDLTVMLSAFTRAPTTTTASPGTTR